MKDYEFVPPEFPQAVPARRGLIEALLLLALLAGAMALLELLS